MSRSGTTISEDESYMMKRDKERLEWRKKQEAFTKRMLERKRKAYQEGHGKGRKSKLQTKILALLSKQDMTINEILEATESASKIEVKMVYSHEDQNVIDVNQTYRETRRGSISRALRNLELKGIIDQERHGKDIYWKLK